MQWHEFIFSEKKNYWLLRHTSFWVSWWLYFLLCYFLYQQPLKDGGISPYFLSLGSHPPVKIFLLVLLYAIACYGLIYFSLPRMIKGNWLKASAGILLVCAFLFITSWLMYWNVFPWIDSLFGNYKQDDIGTRFWPPVSLGLLNFTKVAAAAAIIKYVKYWWLKQRESEKLEKEKINAELQLLKAQIRPGFLFTALNNIYALSLEASPRAPEMLLKLSDLLSYMLYECDEPLVPLEKEIDMMKDYMALEKIRLGKPIEMGLNVLGDMTGKMIAPFLLLPFIENSFKQSSSQVELSWINMDISIEGNSFYMKLTNGVMIETKGVQAVADNELNNVQKRLALLYPQTHDLKISGEQEMLVVFLKIKLDEIPVTEPGKDDKLLVAETTAGQPNIYATP